MGDCISQMPQIQALVVINFEQCSLLAMENPQGSDWMSIVPHCFQ